MPGRSALIVVTGIRGPVDRCMISCMQYVIRSDAAGIATLTRPEKPNELSQLPADTDGMPLAAGLAYEIYRTPGVGPDMRERFEGFMNGKRR